MSRRPHVRTGVTALGVVAALCALTVTLPTAGYASGTAPGAPGDATSFAPADKSGFGTAYGTKSPVWFTLEQGRMSEVYYPNLGTPATRELQFIVTDGRSFATREQSARSRTTLLGSEGLAFRQVVTDRA